MEHESPDLLLLVFFGGGGWVFCFVLVRVFFPSVFYILLWLISTVLGAIQNPQGDACPVKTCISSAHVPNQLAMNSGLSTRSVLESQRILNKTFSTVEVSTQSVYTGSGGGTEPAHTCFQNAMPT